MQMKNCTLKKELIVVLTISVSLISAVLMWAFFYQWVFTELINLAWVRSLVTIIMSAFVILLMIVAWQRIKELKKGEDNDLGKY
ncbi:hypothetical protein CHISP_0948 [Chitinispirillum alkaliphilum]|nr:hypothetical protein CHISP_0948 [Chitinispirillum alkaliphilum]